MSKLGKIWEQIVQRAHLLIDRTDLPSPDRYSDVKMDCLAMPSGFLEDPLAVESETIRMAVVINRDSKIPEAGELWSAFREASDLLKKVTGRTLTVTEICSGRFGRFDLRNPESVQSNRIASHYLDQTKNPPDFVLILATDAPSTPYGGANIGPFPVRQGRHPEFCQSASSSDVIEPVVYGAVVQPVDPYGHCGYERGKDGELQKTGSVSQNGQCRGEEGLTCVSQGDFQLCPGTEDHPKASIGGHLAYKIVHELGHNFHNFWEVFFNNLHCNNELAICPEVWDRLRQAAMKCFSR